MPKEKKFRPNIGVIVTDGQGRVLLCIRNDDFNDVQTVQGGIDGGESPREAGIREVEEEIGVPREKMIVLKESDKKYRYEWSAHHQQTVPSEYVGQEQQFMLVQIDPQSVFTLDTHFQEFKEVRWGMPQELIAGAWEAKRPGFIAALTEFGLLPAVT